MSSDTMTVTTPTDREIAMTRVFDAPRKLVFDALTTPDLVRRWMLGPDGWTMPVCEIDLRVGGAYRYVWRNAKGKEMTMTGMYREVVPHERLVGTETFDDPWYEGEAISTTVLTEQNGKTTLTATVRYDSKAIRDAVLESGMERGVAVSYDRLEAILASAAADERR